jgi:hypothetical protein
LRRDGLAMVRFDDLMGDTELWAQLAEDVSGFVSTAENRAREAEERMGGRRKIKKSDFILRASAIQNPSPSLPFLRYALSDQLLGIANAYLGLRSKLVYVDKWYTVPSPENADRVKSQRWHRDHMDHVLKAFTYFCDVDAAAGALEYVRGSAAGGPYGDLWAWDEANHYPPDGELERLVPPSGFLAAEGPTGTIVLCDTGGFHRGGFARRPRITANFTYVSPTWAASRAKRRFDVEDGMLAGLSPIARVALS